MTIPSLTGSINWDVLDMSLVLIHFRANAGVFIGTFIVCLLAVKVSVMVLRKLLRVLRPGTENR